MIRYPQLQKGAVIGITAPSSGIGTELHPMLKLAIGRMEDKGYRMVHGDTVWTQHKAKSAPAPARAAEFNRMMRDDSIGMIFPPWGGELLIEILEHLQWEQLPAKWIMGYSDISVLLLAVTLTTGLATAHGANLIDQRGEYADQTTGMWEEVLSLKAGESITQYSSPYYQKEWDHDHPSPCIFHLTEPTSWKLIAKNETVQINGRLLGGCIDVIRHLIGTPYGQVKDFQNRYINGEPIIWYLENCELNTVDMRRSLVQMKLAGWFDNCAGLLFGRSAVHLPVDHYTEEDLFSELYEELKLPIVYDIDCGHVPPQITFVNGAYAEIEAGNGKGKVSQVFVP
ncbi:S66 family peptidase [Paenibacillus glycanilyticus]|uniref:S66 family peptidase n=1 Tax=Paenibacillus glycanilyticus TaxID=126569 RepID=UPI003EB99693